MKELVIGVSGINAMDNPGPGTGVARSLKEDRDLHVKTIGLAYDAMEPGLYMDWVIDKSYILPYPSGSGEAYLQRLLFIREQTGMDFVIPNLDVELPLYIKYAGVLAQHGIRTFLPDMEQFRLRGKDRLFEIAERTQISLPRTKTVHSLEALHDAVEEIGLPVMIKGPFYKAYKCGSLSEAIAHYHELVAEWGYPIIIQEIVKGDELNVIGLGDGAGNSLGLVGIKKLSLTSLGKIWTGVTIQNEAMLRAAHAFIREFKWRGPFELECILSGDTVYLIEVNPRFPAWSYFATGVGVNLPSRLVRHVCGLPLPADEGYPAGTTVRLKSPVNTAVLESRSGRRLADIAKRPVKAGFYGTG